MVLGRRPRHLLRSHHPHRHRPGPAIPFHPVGPGKKHAGSGGPRQRGRALQAIRNHPPRIKARGRHRPCDGTVGRSGTTQAGAGPCHQCHGLHRQKVTHPRPVPRQAMLPGLLRPLAGSLGSDGDRHPRRHHPGLRGHQSRVLFFTGRSGPLWFGHQAAPQSRQPRGGDGGRLRRPAHRPATADDRDPYTRATADDGRGSGRARRRRGAWKSRCGPQSGQWRIEPDWTATEIRHTPEELAAIAIAPDSRACHSAGREDLPIAWIGSPNPAIGA